VLLRPSSFFESLPRPAPYWDPVLFALLGIIVGLAGTQVWAELKDWAIADTQRPYSIRMQMAAAHMELFSFSCKAAFAVAAQSVLEVLAAHLTMRWLSPHYQGLRLTWRVCFYALGATAVLWVLPMVGNALAVVWRPIVLALGFATVHRVRMDIAIAGVLSIAAIGELFKTAVSLVILYLSMGNAGGYDYLWRSLLSTL